jgi:short-subunit dehydrogenase
MNILNGKTVLITGVTSGIGKSLVSKLIAEGANVIGVARRQNELEELETAYDGKFSGISADVSLQESWQKITDLLLCMPDVVILNAGNCEYMEQGRVEADLVKRVFQVNFFANVFAAEALLKQYPKDSKFHWVIVSSSAYFFAMPRGEAYGASKAALSYFFESLQLSYAKAKFSIVHPGFVETPLTDKNDFEMPFKISSEKAAEIILHGILHEKKQINFPFVFTWILRILGALPAGLRFNIGKRLVK